MDEYAVRGMELCFNIKGPVVIKNDNVIVRATSRGGSAMKGAETLREEGFKGRVVMVTKEAHLPYDRPLLSKKLNANADSIKLRSLEYLKDHDIEFISGAEATTLDSSKKTVTLSNGTVLNYDNVLIATGGKPRTLNVPGSDLENIFLLRSPDDATKNCFF
ncbi:Apoptosis-inducing factor 3 [Desmophyllum pertusum]|uniref:Apoptosis-inducing factor 3 n=1 Tax=Desmophyllum pertusum TaxID=174260 RepID=A0A9W9YCV0_9CNID|nr:Apoptosis-inducing factor 3 [Desmophyllum pertusum]